MEQQFPYFSEDANDRIFFLRFFFSSTNLSFPKVSLDVTFYGGDLFLGLSVHF